MSDSKPIVDVGILTIRDDEFRAVLAALPDEDTVHRGRRDYSIRIAHTASGGRYRVAVLRQIEQGNGEAQDAARDMLDDLEPSLLLVVGIAAGLPSDDFTLGDVIVSTRVHDFSVEARKSKSRPTYSMSGGPIAKSITGSVANLAARERDLGPWNQALPPRPRVSWSREGQLYGPKAWQRQLKQMLEVHFGRGVPARPPLFAAGAIASSDRLVKDPALLFPWITTTRHLLAVEMESGGAYRAARDRCPMLAIRGISDLVGLKRSDAWTKYACASAAAFAVAYLRTDPVPPKVAGGTGDRGGARPSAPTADDIYTNLMPVEAYPRAIYVAPATVGAYQQAWGRLFDKTKEHITRAWVLHNNKIYSFVDPTDSPLRHIVDTGLVEEHASAGFANSEDGDVRRIFVQLLNGALRDDLGTMGVWFHPDDDVFAFAGQPNEEPRKHAYRNLQQKSSMTVVSHYVSRAKDGRTFPYLRHLACRARFRRLGGRWFAEVEPTYRFTSDGKKKYRFHSEKLAGIKRIEGNRPILSQLILWNDALRAAPLGPRAKLLSFGAMPVFRVEQDDLQLAADDDEAELAAATDPAATAMQEATL